MVVSLPVLRRSYLNQFPSNRPVALPVMRRPMRLLPDFERVDRIGEVWSYPESRS
jgi:hypothetical protein